MTTRLALIAASLALHSTSEIASSTTNKGGGPALTAAATYVVSPTGTDAGTGGRESPWRTIQHCADQLGPGDTCLVVPGHYEEAIRLRRSGTADAPVTIASEAIHGAIVGGTILSSAAHVRIDGFSLSMPSGRVRGIEITGSHTTASNNLVTTTSSTLGQNNVGIHVEGSHNTVKSNSVTNTCFGIALLGDMNTASDNRVFGLRRAGVCGDMDYLRFAGTNLTIDHNRFYGVDLASVGAAHVDCMQTFDTSGVVSRFVLIDGNFCADAHQGIILEATRYRESSDFTIRNNIITRTPAWCMVNFHVRNVLVVNNTCDVTGGLYGLYCRGGASCEFKNNIIYGGSKRRLYGVIDGASLIDGTEGAPGKRNLLFAVDGPILGYSQDIKDRDPLFANRLIDDYALSANSPGLNAALPIGSWLTPLDARRSARPQGTGWDIGAIERPSSIVPPTKVRVVIP